VDQKPPKPNRRTDRPSFDLEQVVALARRQFVVLTGKASNEAARYFGDDQVSIRNEIIDALVHLHQDEWQFTQEQDGQWVDVYRAGIFEDWPDAWIKVKVEFVNAYDAVVVISFHEWD
jgi:hypothetical protein